MSRKIILSAWLVAAVLGLTLIIFTRPKSTGDDGKMDQTAGKTIVGKWQNDGEIAEYRADGTFVVNRLAGAAQGQAIAGRYSFSNATTLQISLEGANAQQPIIFSNVTVNGDRLSMTTPKGAEATYQRVTATATATAKAEPSSANSDWLKAAVIGHWQSAAQGETSEWRDDGALIIKTKQGQTVNCRYTVLDSNRVQVAPEGAKDASAAIWKVGIKEDTMTVNANAGNGAAVATFTRMKGNVAMASPLPSVERQLSPRPTPIQPAQQRPSLDREAQKKNYAEFKHAIVGKWQVPGTKEKYQWTDDGTAVVTNRDGKDLKCTYKATGGNRVMMIADGDNPSKAPIWMAEINGDLMNLTMGEDDGPFTEYLVRLNAKGEPAAVALPTPASSGTVDRSALLGTWTAENGQQFAFSNDGTFKFGDSAGQWRVKGGEVVARDGAGTIWKLTLSPDKRTLAGHWANHAHNMSVIGPVSVTR